MVVCLVSGCSKHSGCDKDVSFYRVPKVTYKKKPRLTELIKRRRQGFLAAISRNELTESAIYNNRVCLRHFISGKPAELEDELNPDWLPTQHLGHSETCPEQAEQAVGRYGRSMARAARSERLEAAHTLMRTLQMVRLEVQHACQCLP